MGFPPKSVFSGPQVVKNNLNPVWEPFKVSLNSLCSCEETRPLKVGMQERTEPEVGSGLAWAGSRDHSSWGGVQFLQSHGGLEELGLIAYGETKEGGDK